jgi:hypothetical protein
MVPEHPDLPASRAAQFGPKRVGFAARAEPLVPVFAYPTVGAALGGIVVVVGDAAEVNRQRYSALRY